MVTKVIARVVRVVRADRDISIHHAAAVALRRCHLLLGLFGLLGLWLWVFLLLELLGFTLRVHGLHTRYVIADKYRCMSNIRRYKN